MHGSGADCIMLCCLCIYPDGRGICGRFIILLIYGQQVDLISYSVASDTSHLLHLFEFSIFVI